MASFWRAFVRLVVFGAWAAPTLAQAAPWEARIDAEAARADIRLAREALEAIHPGYDRYADAAALDAMWTGLEARAATGISGATFYVELSRVLSALRCDHTKAEIPQSWERARAEASFFPFRFEIIDGRAFLVDGLGAAHGDELIAIDGRPAAEIFAAIRPLVAVDGFTDFAADEALGASGEYLGSAFEHFYPLIYGAWSNATVTFETLAGERRSLAVQPIGFDAWRALNHPSGAYRTNFSDAVDFRLEDGVGVLRVDSFVNYPTPVDPEAIYAPIFQRLADAGARALVVDTRLNGGGSTDAMMALLRHLSPEPFTHQKAIYVKTLDLTAFTEHLQTWDTSVLSPDLNGFVQEGPDGRHPGWFRLKSELDPVSLEPQTLLSPRFGGPVYILSHPRNASGVTHMLSRLTGLDGVDVTVIGEDTGGSAQGATAGVLVFLALPNTGIRVRIPLFRQYLDVADAREGYGVAPDIRVVRSREALINGADPVLERALAIAAQAS
ncbi:MAG: S41 family peptidase [Maricaulaceae bacterium]